jgi:O-antigen ligase
MARRGVKSSSTLTGRPDGASAQARQSADREIADEARAAVHVGEFLRRSALGATAALMTARAFWPSEPDLRDGAGSGLSWVLLVLATVGLAIAASLVGGRLRFRFSLTDIFVVLLTVLVASSAAHALDRRPAINLAWEWVGLGLMYVLLRNLPRTRAESGVLAGVIVATAFAVSVYGLYQVRFELPLIQEAYRRNPQQILAKLNIEPGTASQKVFENRLMASNEPWSTFALANSLAGFVAGPLVVAIGMGLLSLVRRDGEEPRWGALLMAAPVILVLLFCLLLTKSRSAYLGTIVGVGLLAWHARREFKARLLVLAALTASVVIVGLVVGGLKTGGLDSAVLTQSAKSLGYRWQYWRGTWGMITEGQATMRGALSAPTFWAGVGPGNFGAQYVKYKPPESSEEILDPHDLFLDVWATAGVWGFVALLGALVCGLWSALGLPRKAVERQGTGRRPPSETRPARPLSAAAGSEFGSLDDEPGVPPNRVSWLAWSAGIGGWVIVVALGRLNPFQGELFFRWLILGASWLIAVFLGAPLWRRQPLPAFALGAGALAIVLNLLAAGGIGIPTVALGLWSLVALGLNARDDRPCGRLREYQTRLPGFALAVGWSAVVGTFAGLVFPFWAAEAALSDAESALARRPADVELADDAYQRAIAADRYFARPWHEIALLHFRVWQERGSRVKDEGSRWDRDTIVYLYRMAATPPRSYDAWSLHSERARVIQLMLNQIGSRLKPIELIAEQSKVVEATRTAARQYPTNADLRARLADASAQISMYGDAVKEANEALRLDGLLAAHPDKQLPAATRERLQAFIPKWSEAAANMPIQRAP